MTEFKKFQVFEILKLLINKLITPYVLTITSIKKKKRKSMTLMFNVRRNGKIINLSVHFHFIVCAPPTPPTSAAGGEF